MNSHSSSLYLPKYARTVAGEAASRLWRCGYRSGRLAVLLWFGFSVSSAQGGDAGPADAAPAPDSPIQILSITVENPFAVERWTIALPHPSRQWPRSAVVRYFRAPGQHI